MLSFTSVVDWVILNRECLQKMLVMRRNTKFTLIWITFVIGSFFHDFFPLPASYFSNRKNFFNVYFVKKGWGWTIFLLSGYISSLLIKQKVNDWGIFYKHLSRLFVTSFFWYTFTTAFEIIEHFTGSCIGEGSLSSKMMCHRKDFLWNGFDISGHCFLLSFCILIINEELNCSTNILKCNHNGVAHSDPEPRRGQGIREVFGFNIPEEIFEQAIEWLGFLLLVLMILWEIMLFFTCLYFHTLSQKLLGFSLGAFCFYASYMCIFKIEHKYAPCVPSMIAQLNHKN